MCRWDNVISKEITDTETIIHELRIRENNILKILKKRANIPEQYNNYIK